MSVRWGREGWVGVVGRMIEEGGGKRGRNLIAK